MTSALGIDWSTDMAAEFGDELYPVTFTRTTQGAFDASNPTSPPPTTTANYTAKGIAFGYAIEQIDGERIIRGNYKVMILLGTIALVADDAVKAALDLATVTIGIDTVLRARLSGIGGNLITVELVGDAVAAAGEIVEVGTNVRIGVLPASTTVADIEALIAGSTLLEIATPGTGVTVVVSGDAFASVALAGGVAGTATLTPGAIPQADDTITIAPPDQTSPLTGTVTGILAVSQASVTASIRGPSL